MPRELSESEIEARVASAFGGERPADDPGSEPTEPETPVEENEEAESAQAPATEPDTREELEGRLRWQDYTKKTTELAAQRKAIEAEQQKIARERESYRQQQEEMAQLAQILQSDPELLEKVSQRYNARPDGRRGPAPEDIDRLVQARVNEALRPVREEAFVTRAEAEVRATAEEFGIAAPEVMQDMQKLIQEGRIDFETPIELVAELLRGRVARSRYKSARAEGEQKIVEQVTQKTRAPSIRPTERVVKERDPDVTKMGENEFKDFLRRKVREGGPT